MYILKNDLDRNRLGISASKKVGNSVVRHRIARLVRESYRRNEDQFIEKSGSGLDIVVVARSDAAGMRYSEAESALLHLAKLHGIK